MTLNAMFELMHHGMAGVEEGQDASARDLAAEALPAEDEVAPAQGLWGVGLPDAKCLTCWKARFTPPADAQDAPGETSLHKDRRDQS